MQMPETEFESYQRELGVINSLANREELLGRILDRQRQSPRDRAWPTESGNELEPEEVWDPSASVNTTYKYLSLNLEAKQEALAKAKPIVGRNGKAGRWRTDRNLIKWLESL